MCQGYLSSVNCRRELARAVQAGTHIVVLMETEIDKGATDEVQLRAELALEMNKGAVSAEHRDAALYLISMVEDERNLHSAVPRVVRWYREKDLRELVFKVIVAQVFAAHDHHAEEIDEDSSQPSPTSSSWKRRLHLAADDPAGGIEEGSTTAESSMTRSSPSRTRRMSIAFARHRSLEAVPTLASDGLRAFRLCGQEDPHQSSRSTLPLRPRRSVSAESSTRGETPTRRVVYMSALWRKVALDTDGSSVFSHLKTQLAPLGVFVEDNPVHPRPEPPLLQDPLVNPGAHSTHVGPSSGQACLETAEEETEDASPPVPIVIFLCPELYQDEHSKLRRELSNLLQKHCAAPPSPAAPAAAAAPAAPAAPA